MRAVVIVLIYQTALFAATCQAIKSGLWSDPSIWSCGNVPSATDSVIIPSNITIDAFTNITHGGIIITQGTFNVFGNVTLGPTGQWDNQGEVNINGDLVNQGTINNQGIFHITGDLINIATWNNQDSLIVEGDLSNEGTLWNSPSSVIQVKALYNTGSIVNYGSILVDQPFIVSDNGSVDNYGSIIVANGNLEIRDNGVFTNYTGAYVEVLNDFLIKDRGRFINQSGAYVLVCDDLKNEDYGILQNNGVISICAICANAQYQDHQLENEDRAQILGVGEICMCGQPYNKSNEVDNESFIAPTQTISVGSNNCLVALASPISIEAIWKPQDYKVELLINSPFYEKVYIERRLEEEEGFAVIGQTARSYFQDNIPLHYQGEIWYRVYVVENGERVYSNIAVVAVQPQRKWLIYPNPVVSGGKLWVQCGSESTFCVLTLYNLQGKVVAKIHGELLQNAFRFSLPSLPQGTYLVRLQTEKALYLGKLLIQHP